MQNAKILLLATLILTSGLAFTQSDRPSMVDQIIINTQRLADLERRVTSLERGGSRIALEAMEHRAQDSAIGAQLRKDIDEIRSVLFAIGSVVVLNLLGLLAYLLKDRLFGSRSSHR